jgi:hypothetical protein
MKVMYLGVFLTNGQKVSLTHEKLQFSIVACQQQAEPRQLLDCFDPSRSAHCREHVRPYKRASKSFHKKKSIEIVGAYCLCRVRTAHAW